MGARNLVSARWWGPREWAPPPFDYTLHDFGEVRWRSGIASGLARDMRIEKFPCGASFLQTETGNYPVHDGYIGPRPAEPRESIEQLEEQK